MIRVDRTFSKVRLGSNGNTFGVLFKSAYDSCPVVMPLFNLHFGPSTYVTSSESLYQISTKTGSLLKVQSFTVDLSRSPLDPKFSYFTIPLRLL